MKHVWLTVAFVGLGGAGSAQDWSGVRVGLQATAADFDTTYLKLGVERFSFPGSGAMTGLYAGYDHQIGNLVLGGEIAYSSGDAVLDDYPGFLFDDMLDLKARVGYAFGRVLPYAVVGYSKTEWVNGALAPVDAEGVAYGIGADVVVTDRLTLGLEYLSRNLGADTFVEFPDDNIKADVSTIALRIGYRF